MVAGPTDDVDGERGAQGAAALSDVPVSELSEEVSPPSIVAGATDSQQDGAVSGLAAEQSDDGTDDGSDAAPGMAHPTNTQVAGFMITIDSGLPFCDIAVLYGHTGSE